MEQPSIVRWTHGEPLPPEVTDSLGGQEDFEQPRVYWQHFGTISSKSLRPEESALTLLIQIIPKDEQQLTLLEDRPVAVSFKALMHKGPESVIFEPAGEDSGVKPKGHLDSFFQRGEDLPIRWAIQDFDYNMPSLYILIPYLMIQGAESGHEYIFGGKIRILGEFFDFNLPPLGIRYDPCRDVPTSRFVYTAYLEDEDHTFSVPPTGAMYDLILDFMTEGIIAHATYSVLFESEDEDLGVTPYGLWHNILDVLDSDTSHTFRVILEHEEQEA